MAVREVVVRVDRVPLAREVALRALLRLRAALRHRNVGEDDRWTRRVADAQRELLVTLDVQRGLRPLVLHDDEHAEAEPRHDLRGLRADGRRVEAALRMRDRA